MTAFAGLTLLACESKSNQSGKTTEVAEEKTYKEAIVDLTHEFSDETIYWVNAKEFELDEVAKGQTDKGYFYSANNFATAEHGGTHIDAPIHFAEKGQAVDQIPLEKLIGSAIKIDVSTRALKDRDYLISVEDFQEWEEREGLEIPEGSIVLLETGYSRFYPDKIKYLGTEERGDDAIQYLHFPGLSPEAAEWLVNNRKINAIGIDTPSIDYGQSEYFKSHVILMTQDIPAFENLTNLDKIPVRDFQIIALPMKIKGGSGGPLRIVAIVKN
ncbi:cyclase family protein [Flavobacteriaceae bacterium R38]|nr:cyclase family protein [Flavobacteriaceae bacterium R38]